jgi:hypothetical protein
LPRPDDHVIVLFGAAGDLAWRKLLPGLFHLFAAGLLPGKCRIIGSARRALTSQQFREHARQSVAEFGTTKPAGEARGLSSGRCHRQRPATATVASPVLTRCHSGTGVVSPGAGVTITSLGRRRAGPG